MKQNNAAPRINYTKIKYASQRKIINNDRIAHLLKWCTCQHSLTCRFTELAKQYSQQKSVTSFSRFLGGSCNSHSPHPRMDFSTSTVINATKYQQCVLGVTMIDWSLTALSAQ